MEKAHSTNGIRDRCNDANVTVQSERIHCKEESKNYRIDGLRRSVILTKEYVGTNETVTESVENSLREYPKNGTR